MSDDGRPPRRWHWHLALLALLAFGCARFQPVTPLHARSADVDIQLSYLRLGKYGQMVFAAQASETHIISQAWFTVPTRSPCSGGTELDDVRVDGGSWVLPAGSHEIALRSSSVILQYGLDTVVDIQTDRGCIRAPAVSQSVPLDASPRVALISTIDALFAPMPGGLWAFIGLQAGAGKWLGPVQLIAQAGYAAASCTAMACGRDAQGNLRTGPAVPVTLEARYGLATLMAGDLANVLFLDARYTVTPFWLPLPDGEQRFTAQSLFGELGWGYLVRVPGPLRHLERAAPIELVVPLGVTIQTGGGQKTEAVFSGGVALRYVLSL
ncbi:MAG TPA: hypothetical protein VHO67_10665 [Polyangia bacterium]|nr:hypothetical protein [Polyangia bacterium]HVZ78428.1 hypothetical protein [Gemmatimonadaceae bacterium]